MPYFLVEEHTSGPYGSTEEQIPYHIVVFGTDVHSAFRAANQQSMKTRRRRYQSSFPIEEEPFEFFFADSELVECVPGYLWQAADGSDIWYEVRFIGTVTQMSVAPPEEREEASVTQISSRRGET